MKTKTKHILIVIGILLITALVNRCHAQAKNNYVYADHTWVYSKDGVLLTNCSKYSIIYNLQIKEAKTIFKPKFQIRYKSKYYYASGIYLNGTDEIHFVDYYTDKRYSFRFGEFEIYTPKYIIK